MSLSKSYEIGCIQEPLACYRVHENNYSRIKLKTYLIYSILFFDRYNF